jgi:c-di-GMP-related signal transduction protein
MQTTKVKNMLTQDVQTFVNDLSLTENIVSAILFSQNMSGQLLDKEVREKVKQKYEIHERTSILTGTNYAYCADLHLHATNPITVWENQFTISH